MENQQNQSSSLKSENKSVFPVVEETRKERCPKKEVVLEKRISEKPSYRLGLFQTESNIMKKYPRKSNVAYICNYCNKEFLSYNAIGGHQKSHKKIRELEKTESSMKPLGISIDPNGSSIIISSFNGVTRDMNYPVTPNTNYNMSSMNGLPSYNYGLTSDNDLKLSFDPFKSAEESNDNGYPLFNGAGVTRGISDMNTTSLPPATLGRFFPEETSYGTLLRDTLPSYNYHSQGLSNDNLSFGPLYSTKVSINNSISPSKDLLRPSNGFFSLQDNVSGSSYGQTLSLNAENKIMDMDNKEDDDEEDHLE